MPTDTIALRPFDPVDAPGLTSFLHRAYAELGQRGLNFTAVDQDVETTLWRASRGRCWVAVDRDAPPPHGEQTHAGEGEQTHAGERGLAHDAAPDLGREAPAQVLGTRGQIVGTVTISLPPGPHIGRLTPVAARAGAWLNQMAVDPDRRGLGIASRLWQTGLAWAAARGVTTIGVDTAAPAKHLQELYSRWGFVASDTIQWPGKSYESIVMLREVP